MIKNNYHICLFIVFTFIVFTAYSSNYTNKIDSLNKYLATGNVSQQEQANTLFQLSLNKYYLQHYPQAIDYANQALIIFQSLDNQKEEGKTLEFIGVYYAEFSDYENSVNYLLAALNIAEEQNDTESINSRKFNIGTTFTEAGNSNKGIKFLKEAAKFYEKDEAKFAKFLVALYTNLGVSYDGFNSLDSASFFYEKAVNLAKKENELQLIGAPLLNIGEIHLKKKAYGKALKYYNLALKEFTRANDIKGIWHTNFGIANVYQYLNKSKESIELLKGCIVHFRATNDLNYLAKSLCAISEIYEKQLNHKLALAYKNELLLVVDSISESEIINKMADTELHYKIEKLQKENESKMQLIEQKKKLSTFRWYGATGGLLVIIIFVIGLYNRNKTKNKLVETKLKNTELEQGKLKSELEFRNKELENFALHIVQKNEFLKDVKSKFKKLRIHASDENIEEIKELNFKINQSLRVNKELEKFRERVDDVNSHFFNLLTDNYPDLTEKEKRLCALLKMNLSSKEIASLNNISEGAVTMARYRLRKKIGLNKEANLAELFQKMA